MVPALLVIWHGVLPGGEVGDHVLHHERVAVHYAGYAFAFRDKLDERTFLAFFRRYYAEPFRIAPEGHFYAVKVLHAHALYLEDAHEGAEFTALQQVCGILCKDLYVAAAGEYILAVGDVQGVNPGLEGQYAGVPGDILVYLVAPCGHVQVGGVEEGVDGVLGHVHLQIVGVEFAVDIGLADVVRAQVRHPGVCVNLAVEGAGGVNPVQESVGNGVNPGADGSVHGEHGIFPKEVPAVSGGVHLCSGYVHEEFVYGGVDFRHIVRNHIGVKGQATLAAYPFNVHGGFRDQEPGAYGRQFVLCICAFRVCREGDYCISVNLFEGRDVVLVLVHEFSKRAVLNSGVHIHVDAFAVAKEIAPGLELKGGKAKGKAVDNGLQGIVLAGGEGNIAVQVDGDPEAAEAVCPQGGVGIGIQLYAAPCGLQIKICDRNRNGIGRKASGDKEGVDAEFGVGLPEVRGAHLAVQLHLFHAQHQVQGVNRVGKHYQRLVTEAYAVNLDVRHGSCRSIGRVFFLHGEDVPVGGGGVKVVGENTRPLYLYRVDVYLALEQGHVVEAGIQALKGNEGVHSGSIPGVSGLHEAEAVSPVCRIKAVKAGVPLMGIGYGQVLGLYAGKREAAHKAGLDFAETDIAFNELRGVFVHQAGEYRRPQNNLEGHYDNYQQSNNPYQDASCYFPSFLCHNAVRLRSPEHPVPIQDFRQV